MCITSENTMMETDEDDKFEAQVAKYNIHFKSLMALIPISQHEEEQESDEEENEKSSGKGKKQKGKNNDPPGGKYGSKQSKKLKNQYKPGMSLADAIKTKRQARKQSKAKAKGKQDKTKQGKFKGKPDKFRGKHRPNKNN